MHEIDWSKDALTREAQYRAVLAALSTKAHRPRLLRVLLKVIEEYRSARRIGWSRPQNKLGVTTFCTFSLTEGDLEVAEDALSLLESEVGTLGPKCRAFVRQLIRSESLMGFLFYQDYIETDELHEQRRFETVALSLGRPVASKHRFLDRLDLLFDAEVRDHRVGGLSRVRVVADPFEVASPETHYAAPSPRARRLLERFAAIYRANRGETNKRWSHWNQDYIEYFGPRKIPLEGTRFPSAIDDAYASMLETMSTPRETLSGAA